MNRIRKTLIVAAFLAILLGLTATAHSQTGSLDEAATPNKRAIELYQAGRYQEALPLYEQALNMREHALGPEHPDTASSLNYLALLYWEMGSYDKALPLYERALNIREKVLGPEHPDTATSLNNLAVLHKAMGSHDKALPLYERALDIREQALGPEHPDTALSLNNLAELYREMGSYDKALPLCERALKIKEQALGPEHPGTATSLNNLALLYNQTGSYGKALPLYERALKIREQALGLEHPHTALSLNNLAELYRKMGSYDKALPLYERASSIFEKALGPEHPHTATSFNNLALLYDETGSYDKALPLLERALKIREKALGPEHPDTAAIINNLAALYWAMGSYDKALPLYERALKIREKALGPEHPDTALSLSNLAELYRTMGSYDKALQLLERAVTIKERARGSEHPSTAISLANLGGLHLDHRDFPRAEAYFLRSKSKSGLVALYLATGKNAEALELLQKIRPSPTATSPYQIQFYTQEGLALIGTGRRMDAAESLLKAVRGIEELRTRVVGERGGFLQAGYFGGYLRAYRGLVSTLAEASRQGEKLPASFRNYGEDPASAGFYFAEATKARSLLEAMAEAARKKTRVEIPEDLKRKEENLLQQLSTLNAQWEKALKGGTDALEEARTRKEKLNGELDLLITELRKNHHVYAALHYPRPVPAKDLPLKPQEVLLEYALGDRASDLFLVRKSGVEKVLTIPLGREALEAKVKTFMDPLLNHRGTGFSAAGAKELYDLLLSAALSGVKETDELLIIPDGILGLLPFEALVVREGSGPSDAVYVGDRYSIRYYQSAAVLALQRTLKAQKASKALFALGNPVFSSGDERYLAFKAGKEPPVRLAQNTSESAYRGLAIHRDWGKTTQDDEGAGELVYAPLPETETEVRSIAELLGVATKAPDILLNLDASESHLQETHLKDYRYVHFATHADLPGKVQGVNEPFILLGQVENRGGTDGFLTMSKVLGLELRAEMVALSACVTGRGQVMQGEGVVNFARAFQHAGARSVVVSLWEVASQEAVEYMKSFYTHLKAGKTRSEALRLARSEIKSKYPNPFFWAVFILHGEG
jgi:tetratricopeptide (TPR) repeat protein